MPKRKNCKPGREHAYYFNRSPLTQEEAETWRHKRPFVYREEMKQRHAEMWRERRWGVRRRLSAMFAFVALAAVGITTWFTLGAVFGAQQELLHMSTSSGDLQIAKEALARVTRTAFIAGLLSFFLASFVAGIATRFLTQPLKALTDGARKLAAGERGIRLDLPPARDELRVLTLAFNGLVEGLEEQEAWRRNMVADIAHDLRTPLAVLRSEIEGMQDGVVKQDRASLERLHAEVMLLTRLVADLRTLSLVESGGISLAFEKVSVKTFLERISTGFSLRAQELGSSLELDIYPENLSTKFDPEQMTRVLSNLIDNALRYASPGTIEIKARRFEEGLKLSVRDHGPGLPQEALEQVFERFYRTDRARTSRKEGSGLGLAIARAIVEAHGGRLEAENHLEGGVQFELSLPDKQAE